MFTLPDRVNTRRDSIALGTGLFDRGVDERAPGVYNRQQHAGSTVTAPRAVN